MNMTAKTLTQETACSYCSCANNKEWATELGFSVVRCEGCGLLFVSPVPSQESVNQAVRSGTYNSLALNVTARRIPRKIKKYWKVFRILFADVWRDAYPITWVDVGCGYGEVLEAVSTLAPAGSLICGYEPMTVKAEKATSMGLHVTNDYLTPHSIEADVISAVDIFSHIPDFHSFLTTVATNLRKNGLLYLETGNLADLNRRIDFPGELGVPDHLVFAGEKHLRGYLDRAGFDIESVDYVRIDGFLELCKNIVKCLLGRPFFLQVPYTSKYRQLLIRARLRNDLNRPSAIVS